MKFFNTIYYILALFLFKTTTNAQEINLPTSIEDVKQVYHHNANNKNYFLLFENQRLQIVQSDEQLNFQKTVDVAIDLNIQSFNTVIANNDNLTTFWITKKEINAITTNLTNGTSTTANSYPLKEKGEELVATFVYKDFLYVLKALKQTNILKLTSLDSQLNIKQERIFNFSDKNFINVHKETLTLYQALNQPDLYTDSAALTFMEIDKPNSLVLAVAKNKYYVTNDKLFITLDGSKIRTDVLVIDLQTNLKNHYIFNQDYDRTGSVYYSSNSVLFDNKILQFCGGSSFLSFIIRDEKGEILKHYNITKNNETNFITGDVLSITDNALNRDSTKEITKLNKVINKIGGGYYKGITAYPLDNNYIVQFGEVEKVNINQAVYTALIGGAIGGMIGAALPSIFHPLSSNMFNPYRNTSATVATTVLNQDFEPNPTFEIEEDNLAKLRQKKFIDLKNKMYKIIVKINNQDYYIKHEFGSKTIDLMPF